MQLQNTGEKKTIRYRMPEPKDAVCIHSLIESCKPLDLNSTYAYLLLSYHFSDTCLVAETEKMIGVTTAYCPPRESETLFVWQIAVAPEWRGQKIALRMLQELLMKMPEGKIRFVEATVNPSNRSSQRLFETLADSLGADLQIRELFPKHFFGPPESTSHESENLIRIGPIKKIKKRGFS